MTGKELLYIEDALGHENFMKSCSTEAIANLTDPELSNYMENFAKKHTDLANKFLNLL